MGLYIGPQLPGMAPQPPRMIGPPPGVTPLGVRVPQPGGLFGMQPRTIHPSLPPQPFQPTPFMNMAPPVTGPGAPMPQQPSPSPLQRMQSAFQNNPSTIMALASGMLAHRRNANVDPFGGVAQGMYADQGLKKERREEEKEAERESQTERWLQDVHGLSKEEAAAAKSNPAILNYYLKKNDAPDYPTSYEEHLLAQNDPEYAARLAASKSGTTVNVAGMERGYDKAVGEGYAKRWNDLQTGAGDAQSAITSLGIMEQAVSDPGFYSGIGADQVLQLKRLGAAIGADPSGISSMETFNAMAKQAAISSMGGSLGTGFSNADRSFVEGQVPSLQNTPEGNRALIEITRKINQRKIEMAQLARDYAEQNEGRIDAGFDDYARQYAEANPLFPQQQAAPNGVDPGLWEHMTPEERELWQ